VLDDHRRILFLGVGQDLEQRGQCGSGLSFAKHLISDRCMGVNLCEFLVSTFGLPESCGFVTLACDHVAKGGTLVEKVPLQGRSRVTQGRQILEDP
jgi:hypothetical protein